MAQKVAGEADNAEPDGPVAHGPTERLKVKPSKRAASRAD
jgi:hypothetical protein